MKGRALVMMCAAGFLLAACANTTPGDVVPGTGTRFVPQVVEFSDDAGLGNAVTVGKDGNPYMSYLIFPAVLQPGEIPVSRPIGAPYIQTAVVNSKPAKDGAAVGVSTMSADGIWTRGAAAQVRDTPAGITIPFGPVTEPSLIGATAENTNGTDIAVDASGGTHVVWAGKDGIYYGNGSATASFAVTKIFDYGSDLDVAGPIGRPSVAVDAQGTPWVAYAVVSQKLEIRVATLNGTKWKTTTAATLDLCNGCSQPGPARIGVTPDGPVVAYADPGTQTVQAAALKGSTWTSETVATGVSGEGLDLAIGKDGREYLSYYDGKGSVDVSIGSGGGWTNAKVASAAPASPSPTAAGASPSPSAGLTGGNFAETTGVAVDDKGTIYVTYYDGASDGVMLASGDGSAFKPVATTDTSQGAYPSVAVTPDGSFVYVTWYGTRNQDLLMGTQGDVKDVPVAAPSPTPSAGAVAPPSSSCGSDGKVALDISAQNIAFDTNCLVAESGKPFTVTFDNKDTAIPHNFALFTTQGGDSLGATEIAPGPGVQKLDVKPLDAGTYFFQCDVHPTAMFGQLVVVKPSGK